MCRQMMRGEEKATSTLKRTSPKLVTLSKGQTRGSIIRLRSRELKHQCHLRQNCHLGYLKDYESIEYYRIYFSLEEFLSEGRKISEIKQ